MNLKNFKTSLDLPFRVSRYGVIRLWRRLPTVLPVRLLEFPLNLLRVHRYKPNLFIFQFISLAERGDGRKTHGGTLLSQHPDLLVEVPNPLVDVDSWRGSACYP